MLARPIFCRALQHLFSAALALAVPFEAHGAQESPSADAPCLRRVCVGDELSRLLDLPWLPVAVATNERESAQATELLRSFIRADEETLALLAPYWMARRFDAFALRGLMRVTAVCRDLGVWMRPVGSYRNDDGQLITVSFEPVATATGQTFRVATLTRVHPQGTDPSVVAIVGREVAAKYAGLPLYPTDSEPAAQWLPKAEPGPTLRLFAPLGDAEERSADLGRHPACGSR